METEIKLLKIMYVWVYMYVYSCELTTGMYIHMSM